jgi:hypothetical protein
MMSKQRKLASRLTKDDIIFALSIYVVASFFYVETGRPFSPIGVLMGAGVWLIWRAVTNGPKADNKSGTTR